MRKDWSEIEIDFILADYFSMLNTELMGGTVNKSEHRRMLRLHLYERSESSIEFKHRNISAVLESLDMPSVEGYKPLYNFQRSLVNKIQLFIDHHQKIENVFEIFTELLPENIAYVNFNNWMVPPPEIKSIPIEKNDNVRKAVKVNYLKKEQDNRALGIRGEELVFNYEKFNLTLAGKTCLADKVEWTSRDRGDGLGYDILSKNLDGTDKFIEVKR